MAAKGGENSSSGYIYDIFTTVGRHQFYDQYRHSLLQNKFNIEQMFDSD